MRRLLALAGFFVVLALALALLWRVYLHHDATRRYAETPEIVWLDAPVAPSVKIATDSR